MNTTNSLNHMNMRSFAKVFGCSKLCNSPYYFVCPCCSCFSQDDVEMLYRSLRFHMNIKNVAFFKWMFAQFSPEDRSYNFWVFQGHSHPPQATKLFSFSGTWLTETAMFSCRQQGTKSLETDGVSRAGYRDRKNDTSVGHIRLILLTNITVVRYQIIFIERCDKIW